MPPLLMAAGGASVTFHNAPAARAAPNTWAPAAPLDGCRPASPACAGRSGHAAVLLNDGRVLVVGGITTPTTAQLYDSANGSWAPTAPLKESASLVLAALLRGGKVLVIGDGTPQIYDPADDSWTVTPPPRTPHPQGTATVLPDGRVLVAGGLGGERGTAAVDIYDPATNTWAPTAPLIQVRSQHVAALLPDGKVLVAGGFSENYGPQRSTAELYDPATGTWAPTGELAAGAVGLAATLLPDGKVLVTGGQGETGVAPGGGGARTAQVYDPARGAWTPAGQMTSGRSGHSATLLPDGTVLVVGGVTTVPRRGAAPPEEEMPAELYDPARGTWSGAARPAVARSTGHSATLLPGGPPEACRPNCGKVLVVGGRGGIAEQVAATTKSAELYEAPPGSVAPAPTAMGTSDTTVARPAASGAGAGANESDDDGSLPLAAIAGAGAVAAVALVSVVRRRRLGS